METFGILTAIFSMLAPLAFVLALGALSYIGKLKKDMEQVKKEIEELKGQ